MSTGRRGQRVPRPMDISQFQGWTLQQVEDRIRNLDHEELFVFDRDGNIVAAYRGNANSVAFYHDELMRDGATVTHGHPKGSEGYGGTFSPQDVLNMAASDWAEHRATASGQGEMNYIMRRTSSTTSGNSSDLYARVSRDAPNLEAQMRAAANAAGATTAPARRQIYVGVLDRYWRSVLPQYNFEYVKRKTAYNYGR